MGRYCDGIIGIVETALCTERVDRYCVTDIVGVLCVLGGWGYCNVITDTVKTVLCTGRVGRYCDGITDILKTALYTERVRVL